MYDIKPKLRLGKFFALKIFKFVIEYLLVVETDETLQLTINHKFTLDKPVSKL